MPGLRIERLLWNHGVSVLAGVDEAGRGAWAGPVVAAAVVLAPSGVMPTSGGTELPAWLSGVRDSKQLSASQRDAAAEAIRANAVAVGVGVVPPNVIDECGLAFAGQLAFWRAVTSLPLTPDFLLVDGFPLWSPRFAQLAVLQGDARCCSIAAASVIAKTTRDAIMCTLDGEAPGYGLAHNVGYGTAAHRRALAALGPSPYHRRSYAPVAAMSIPLEE